MERIGVLFLAILLLFAPNSSAIPSEGNFFPELNETLWAIQSNNIFLRDFNKVEGKASTAQCFVQASYGISERFFLDGKVGIGNVSFNVQDGVNLDFHNGFAGGYGVRYIAHENKKKNIKSIFGFQHISCHPFKDKVNDVQYRVIWDEWQGTWLFIKEYEKASVYIGPQYSAAQLKYKVDSFRRRLKSEDNWGMLVGGNYNVNKNLMIQAEVRLFDEWALNFGISHKF
ncbi:MAG: hypothetical protein KKD05_12005 [Candidatus Omnitrophica bacterium]|nr:hypothetical protein [Candidatus Omnitrophota bacterium]